MTTRRTTYSVSGGGGCLTGILGGLLLGAVLLCVIAYGTIYGVAWITGDAFDGNLMEPGCDWGNSHCELEDYREMCIGEEAQDSPPSEAQHLDFCTPIGEGVAS